MAEEARVTLEPARVLARRVARQHLAPRRPATELLGVVRDIAGAHAQVASSAELTLWTRLDGLEQGAVDRALWEERTLVKTWAMRGTLHLLPAEERGLWVTALSQLKPRHHTPAWLRYHGLERDEAEAMVQAIPEALAGQWLTREELAREVAAIVGRPHLEEKLRGGFGDLLKPAAFGGELCFAPSEGQRVRFARPRDWLGTPPEPVDPEEAVREVVRRYLGAFGPATREHFARWFGMPSPAQAGRWIRSLGDEVVAVETEGVDMWLLAEDLEEARTAEPTAAVRLLPAFDHYVVAAPRDSAAVLAPGHRARVYRPQGWMSPVVIVDGVIVGVWRHEIFDERVSVDVEPFGDLPGEVREDVEGEARRLGELLGIEASVEWGRAEAGAGARARASAE